jgi:hypothetical protein
MMTPDQAFLAGLSLVRADGIPAKGHDVAVRAAHTVFLRRAEGKQFDPRFDADGPRYARQIILEAYSVGG